MTAFALFPSFIAQGPETLILDPSLLSLGSDDYHIRLSNGTPLLRVGGKSLSMSGRKKVFDEQGTHLFDVVRSVMHMHSTYVVEDARGVGVVEVKWGMKVLGSKATATFAGQSGKQGGLSLKGGLGDRSAEIVDESQGNVVVAKVDRKVVSGFNKQTYAVTVAPGVDMALIAALCICLNEKNHEAHKFAF